MNLLGPELVRDLVSLIQHAEADAAVQVLVFTSADPDYFISHVDVTRIPEYRAEAAMRFAARESAIFGQFEPAFGALPAAGHALVKDRVDAIALAPVEDFRHDSDLFAQRMATPEGQGRTKAAFERGFQTRDAEMALGELLGA